jgi:hypothetical protein
MRVVDDVILATLEATAVTIHDGLVDADNSTKEVTYDLPFAVYYSSVGDDDNRRLSGREGRRSVFFSITYVGLDRQQTKWAGEQIRAALQGQRLVIPGHRSWLVDLQESQRVRRDDDAIRPDGSPLFYGVDNYALSIQITH